MERIRGFEGLPACGPPTRCGPPVVVVWAGSSRHVPEKSGGVCANVGAAAGIAPMSNRARISMAPSAVFLIAAEAIQRFGEDDVEAAAQRVPRQLPLNTGRSRRFA
jgi:hypothetical protein